MDYVAMVDAGKRRAMPWFGILCDFVPNRLCTLLARGCIFTLWHKHAQMVYVGLSDSFVFLHTSSEARDAAHLIAHAVKIFFKLHLAIIYIFSIII